MRKHPVFRNILLDLVCAGLALVVFALFHHVLPRQQQSLGIAISDSYHLEKETDTGLSTVPEPAGVTASASVSDVLSASGSRQISGDPQNSGSQQNSSSRQSSVGQQNSSGRGSRSGKGGKGSGMNGKGGSALEEDADSAADKDTAAVEASDIPISDKFADKYTDTVIVTENSYSSPDISVTVTEETLGQTTYYLADIYVRDITCFRSALANETYGSGFRDSIEDMALLNNALLAVNGDYYGNTNEGVVIRNGVIYRANSTNCDVCVLYYDGTMRVMPGSSFSVEEAVEQGAWQAWTFGPALLNTDGSVLTSFASTNRIISANPRTAIGYYEPGHYCLVVVDGRGESAGITLPDLSRLFYDLGCKAAYNLDGGNSSVMVWNNEVINNPSGGGRESSDALLIAEVNANE